MSNASTNVLNRFKREQAETRQLIELYTSGKMKTGSKEGDGPWVDNTVEESKRLEADLAELDAFIAELETR